MADSSFPVIAPVFQLIADNPLRYNYSSDPDAGTSQGWTRQGIAFFAFGKNQPSAVPVYLYFAEPWHPQFTLTNKPPGPGWNYGGIAFYANNTQTPDTLAVYEFQSQDLRYQYSTNGSVPGPGWTLNGVKFYTFGATPAAAEASSQAS